MNDDNLKRGFGKLRQHDARHTPSFEEIVRHGRARKSARWAVIVPLASSAAAAAVFLVWCQTAGTASAPPPAPVVAAAGGDSKADGVVDAVPAAAAAGLPPANPDPAPLDFLLTLPGSSALSRLDIR